MFCVCYGYGRATFIVGRKFGCCYWHGFPIKLSQSRTIREIKTCPKTLLITIAKTVRQSPPPPAPCQLPVRHDQDATSARQGSRDDVYPEHVQGIGQLSRRTGAVRNAHVRDLRGVQDGDAQEIPGGCCTGHARARFLSCSARSLSARVWLAPSADWPPARTYHNFQPYHRHKKFLRNRVNQPLGRARAQLAGSLASFLLIFDFVAGTNITSVKKQYLTDSQAAAYLGRRLPSLLCRAVPVTATPSIPRYPLTAVFLLSFALARTQRFLCRMYRRRSLSARRLFSGT